MVKEMRYDLQNTVEGTHFPYKRKFLIEARDASNDKYNYTYKRITVL